MGKCCENGFSLRQVALGRAQDHGAEGGGDPQEELFEILLLSLLSFSNEENQPISLPGETEATQHPPGLAQVFPMNMLYAVAHFPSGHLQPQTSPWPPGLHRPPWGSHCLPPAPAAAVQRSVQASALAREGKSD